MYEDFLKQIEDLIFVEDQPEKADIIFVPGNGYPQMAENAANLYREGFAPFVLPSGRYSVTTGHFSGVLEKEELYFENYETEWDFLRAVLKKNHVPDEAILKENQATFTYENAVYSRQVTDQKGLVVRKAILCCKNYHARRALMYYQQLYPETEFLICPSCTENITRQNWKETQEGVNAVTGEINRMITQFTMMKTIRLEKE